MAKQTLFWTVLPNGIDRESGGLRVSVLLSPRLEPAGAPQRLDSFRDFMDGDSGRCWIDTIGEAAFTFTCGSKKVERTASDIDRRLDRPDAATWKALFRPTTLVRDYKFSDRTDTRVLSFDAIDAHRLLQDTYHDAADGADDLPAIGNLLQKPSLKALILEVSQLDRAAMASATLGWIDEAFERYVENDYPVNQPTQRLLRTFRLFHTPPSKPTTQTYTSAEAASADPLLTNATWRTHAQTPLPAPSAFATMFDFHQIVTAMQQYPRLLRRLGLVLDFVIPRGSFTQSPDAMLSVNVTLRGTSAGVTRKEITSRTHVRIARAVFEPVPTPNGGAAQAYAIAGGLLRPDERLFVLQVDVDASMHKLMNFARTLMRKGQPERQLDPVTKLPLRAGLPALRNGGISLVHRGRGGALEKTFSRAKALNVTATGPSASPELWWEDLIMGFRTDAWDRTTRRWRSLCERVSQYILDGGVVTVNDVLEEGTIRMAVTSAADGSRPKLVSLHETIVTWAGWSLAARAPTQTIDKHDAPAAPDTEIPPGLRLRTEFVAAPGSLPRLRYGRSYALRARVVDLAGNSLPPRAEDYGDERPDDRARPYLRFEPVPAPNLALVSDGATVEGPREGESMDHLAIRTLNEIHDDPTPATQLARRHGVPQRTNVREAELHGMLDAGGKIDPSTYGMLVAQDKDLPSTIITLAGPMGESPDDAEYAVLERGAPLPYLPDPLSEVIAARFLNHARISAQTVIDIPLYPSGSWPAAVPFLIEVYESAVDAPRYVAARHTLRVPLAKAARTTLRLSSRLSAAALSKLGVWQWLDRPALASKARQGRLWALTPWRDVEIVHATQRPLLAPDIVELQIDRLQGDTYITPFIRSRCSIASTARVDLRARWHEPRDAAADGGRDVAKTDTATTIKITDPTMYAATHDMPPGDPLLGASDHAITAKDEIAIGSDKLNAPSRIHDFGDTRYRRIEYWYDATTRFREYLTHDLLTEEVLPGTRLPSEKRISVSGAKTRTWVPSSATPPAPKVLYVVPTFEWVRTTGANGKKSSLRRGGGIRVYLDRPWNESGYGEMLAVVLLPSTTAAVPDANSERYKAVVTQWGNDPAWKSPFVEGQAPKRAAFSLRREAADPTGAWLPSFAPSEEADQPPGPFRVTGLQLPATPAIPATATAPAVPAQPGPNVDIAPHDVFYDAQRQLWYCDIEVSPAQSYFPFVRLALARYQPVSLSGCHLSNVVLADFMALTPSRWLSVTPSASPMRRHVSVYGYSHSESAGWRENVSQGKVTQDPATGKIDIVVPSGIAPRNVIELWMEELQPDLGEDLGWHRVSTTATRSTPGVIDMPSGPILGREARPDTSVAGAVKGPALTRREITRYEMLLGKRQFEPMLREGLLERMSALTPLWHGSVMLTNAPTAGRRYRMVIAEYEEYLVDDADPYTAPDSAKDRRLVFVEHVELG